MENKEFEALDRLIAVGDASKYWNCNNYVADVNIVKQALTELQAIKEVEPSKALECLEDIYRNGVFISYFDALGKQHPTNISPETNKSISEQCNTIKQALLKAQEQEKVLEIIKELFDIQIIETDSKEMATITISRKDSNSALHFAQKLIKDKGKINLLKRWFDEIHKN